MTQIIYVLVNPAVPENVGFSLRAMNTMGFKELRIVGNFDIESDAVRKTAYGSHKLFESTSVHDTLEEAIKDIDLVVGTSSKRRTVRNDIIPADLLASEFRKKGETVSTVAIVFGNEENGLTKDELSCCHLLSSIPLAASYPSLNLAQAVMIYCYELSELKIQEPQKKEELGDFAVLIDQMKSLLGDLELERSPVLYQKILDRVSGAGEGDIQLMLTVLNKIKRKL